jgi:protein-S-isoprenylcysteine O-methyltransferase Ste14
MVRRIFAAIRSLVYASGFVLLWWYVMLVARPLDSRLAFTIPGWARIPGFIIATIGAVLALWSIGTFALIGRGTPAPFDAPREFVAVGPYRFVRNPMYIGAMAVIVGAGLILHSPSAIAVASFFFLVTHVFVLIYEEPSLEERFGNSYIQYKKSVHRWLPRFKIYGRT